VSPWPYDENGNNTRAGNPKERNDICKRECYGDEHIDFKSNHRYSVYRYDYRFDNFLNHVFDLLNTIITQHANTTF